MIVVPEWLRLWKRMEAWEDAIMTYLADNECEHGALPTDPDPPCDCWADGPDESSSDSSSQAPWLR